MSDLVGNPEDRFSHNEAQIIYHMLHNTLTGTINIITASVPTSVTTLYFLLAFKVIKSILDQSYDKEFVLLRRAISLKVNYEKVKFSNCVFCDNFSDYKLTYM